MANLVRAIDRSVIGVAGAVLIAMICSCSPLCMHDEQLQRRYPSGEARAVLLQAIGDPNKSIWAETDGVPDAPFGRAIKRLETEYHKRVIRCDRYDRPRPASVLNYDEYVENDYVGYDEDDHVIGAVRQISIK